MSYDILWCRTKKLASAYEDACDDYSVFDVHHTGINITFNVRAILDKCFKCDCWYNKIGFKNSKYVAKEVRKAISFISKKSNIAELEKLEPENKWGTVEDTKGFLIDLKNSAEELNGEGFLVVSK